MTKFLKKSSLIKEIFILAHSFKGFSSRSAGSIALDLRQGKIPWQLKHMAKETAQLRAVRKHRESAGGGGT
jgi:hypothetical protein